MAEPFGAHTNDQRSALLGVLSSLSAEDWTRATPCRGWSIHDVVAHVIEGELLFGRVYRGELQALTTEDADPQAGVERWSRSDGETLRFSLWHHGSATQRVIDSRSNDSWERELEVFGRPLRLRHVLRLHFFDLALHSQDVTTALDVPTVWGERVTPIVEYCLRAAPELLSRSGVDAPGPIGIVVSEVGSWSLHPSDGTWRLAEAGGAAEASWETDPETLVRATTGRIAPADAIGRSSVGGDAAAVERVLSAWRVKG